MSSFAPRGHAHLDPQRPSAFAICDMCGFLYNRRDLKAERQFHGRELRNTGHLVCPTCWDAPNPTLRPIVLPPDPVPIYQPRSEPTFVGLPETTFAGLPIMPDVGTQSWVIDSTTRIVGAIIVGGGPNKVLATYNGTNWLVTGGTTTGG